MFESIFLLKLIFWFRPCLHEYVLNENAMIVLYYTSFHTVFIFFSLQTVFKRYRFQTLSFSVVFVWMQGENTNEVAVSMRMYREV